MGALFYLYRKNLKNRAKKALRKPVTYLYLALILFYLFALPASFRLIVEQFALDTPEGMACVITVMSFCLLPANIIAYAKRKGLVYRNSDVHFLFPSPISPKSVLVYAHLRTLLMQLLLNLFAVVYGGMLFHVEPWKLAVYFVFSIVVENLFEGCIMLLLYGSEKLTEDRRGMIVKAAYGLVFLLAVIGIVTYLREGLNRESVMSFLHSGMVQMVPFVGWYIAVVHLLFMGATPFSLAGAVLYLLAFCLTAAAAWRMKCAGGYYEDAIKFAEDYEEVLSSRRQGNVDRRLGKKKHFGKASVRWKGNGARAILYRQLLEYKKSRYFIFDINTLAAVLCGIGIAWLYVREEGFGDLAAPYIIPGVSAYLIFIFTTMNGKWAKEITSPYTYLLPDSPFHKLLCATGIQLLQSVINGCLIVLPGAVVMGLSPVTTALSVVFYVALYANKLYALAVAEVVVGNALGRVGKQLLQLLIQSLVIGAAVLGALAGRILGTVEMSCLLMDLALLMFTAVFMVIATLNFYKMEAA